MRLHVVNHPLVSHKLTVLRDEGTDSPTFRRLTDELVTLAEQELQFFLGRLAQDLVEPEVEAEIPPGEKEPE